MESRNLLSHLHDRLFRDPERTGLPGLARRLLQLTWAVLRDALAGHLGLRVTGLVYITILSVVPVIALSFSLLKAFGLQQELVPLLNEWLAPLGPGRATVVDNILGFVANVQGDVLAGVGLVLLFLTTMSMAERVEDSFNFIWRVDRSRNLARRFGDYLIVILVGPVVMSTALGLIAALESTSLARELAGYAPVHGALGLWRTLAPQLLVCVAFSVIYWFVPNTTVRWPAAAAGGLVGGSLWAGAGMLFAGYTAAATQTLAIYATFAIAILALVWLYLCWFTLLIGAQVSFYVQHPEYLRSGYQPVELGARQMEGLALSVMVLAARGFAGSGPRPAAASAAATLGVPASVLGPVLRRLEAAGLLTRSEREELLPNRDPQQITVTEILEVARGTGPAQAMDDSRWPGAVRRMERELADTVAAKLAGRTLAELTDVEKSEVR